MWLLVSALGAVRGASMVAPKAGCRLRIRGPTGFSMMARLADAIGRAL